MISPLDSKWTFDPIGMSKYVVISKLQGVKMIFFARGGHTNSLAKLKQRDFSVDKKF